MAKSRVPVHCPSCCLCTSVGTCAGVNLVVQKTSSPPQTSLQQPFSAPLLGGPHGRHWGDHLSKARCLPACLPACLLPGLRAMPGSCASVPAKGFAVGTPAIGFRERDTPKSPTRPYSVHFGLPVGGGPCWRTRARQLPGSQAAEGPALLLWVLWCCFSTPPVRALGQPGVYGFVRGAVSPAQVSSLTPCRAQRTVRMEHRCCESNPWDFVLVFAEHNLDVENALLIDRAESRGHQRWQGQDTQEEYFRERIAPLRLVSASRGRIV